MNDRKETMMSLVKNVVKYVYPRHMTILCLMGIIGITFYTCLDINAASKELMAKVRPEKASYDSLLKEKSDSMMALYDYLDKRVGQAEHIVGNYQSDADVFIGKTTEMLSWWLGVSTAFVGIVIGLSVWNNYRQEKSAEKVKRELECTAQINKIGSIMTCLNSLPDPLLSESESDRRLYIKNNINLLHHEFGVYVKLIIKNKDSSDYDLKYVQLVLSVMKIALLKVQNVFSDRVSNVAFYTFSSTLEKCIKDIQDGSITHKDLKTSLKSVLGQFDKLRAAL